MAAGNESDVWSDAKAFRRRVRLASVQAASLAESELGTALAYEVEPLSGIPASEAETAWRPVDDPDPAVRVFDVAVRRRRTSPRRSGGGAGGGGVPKAAIAFAVAVLAAVAVDFAQAKWRLGALGADVEERRGLSSQVAMVDARASAARREAAAIRSRRESLAAAREKAAELRGAYARMMSLVASSCGGRAVVRSFSAPSPFVARFDALATGPDAAAETMARLGADAAAAGWRLEQGAVETVPGGSAAAFSFVLSFAEEGGR